MTIRPGRKRAEVCACGEPAFKGARCKECAREAHRILQNERRAKQAKRCKCGRKMGREASVCRKCNGADMGKRTNIRRRIKEATEPLPAVPTEYRVPMSRREALEADRPLYDAARTAFIDSIMARRRA
jgi:hypothetical protein